MEPEQEFETGTPNPHLSLPSANGCKVARAFWVKAFVNLDPLDQFEYLQAQDNARLTLLAIQLMHQGSGLPGIFAFAMAEVMPDDVEYAVEAIGVYIQDIVAMDADEAAKAVTALLDTDPTLSYNN